MKRDPTVMVNKSTNINKTNTSPNNPQNTKKEGPQHMTLKIYVLALSLHFSITIYLESLSISKIHLSLFYLLQQFHSKQMIYYQ